jgi:hypothetical protein
LAIELGELKATHIGPGVVSNQQGVPAEVTDRGARYLPLKRHRGARINDNRRDVNRAGRLTALRFVLQRHDDYCGSYRSMPA